MKIFYPVPINNSGLRNLGGNRRKVGTEQFPVPIQLLSKSWTGNRNPAVPINNSLAPSFPYDFLPLGSKYPKKTGALRAPDGLNPYVFMLSGS